MPEDFVKLFNLGFPTTGRQYGCFTFGHNVGSGYKDYTIGGITFTLQEYYKENIRHLNKVLLGHEHVKTPFRVLYQVEHI